MKVFILTILKTLFVVYFSQFFFDLLLYLMKRSLTFAALFIYLFFFCFFIRVRDMWYVVVFIISFTTFVTVSLQLSVVKVIYRQQYSLTLNWSMYVWCLSSKANSRVIFKPDLQSCICLFNTNKNEKEHKKYLYSTKK